MTQEDKELLLKYLCMALPSGVICEDMEGKTRPLFGITPTQHFIVTLDNATDGTNGLKYCTIDCIKPYLRPMSTMTDEERNEYNNLYYQVSINVDNNGNTFRDMKILEWLHISWFLKNHFDFMGLIEKGLALEAPEEMYKHIV